MRNRVQRWGGAVGWLSGLLLSAGSGISLAQPVEREELGPRLAQAGARLAWQISLPLGHSDSIRSYHLMEENIYALAGDGKAHCVQADIGRYRWVRQVVGKTDAFWPPVLYPALWGDELEGDAVAFTRLNDVIFFRFATGTKIGTRQVRSVNKAGAAMGPNALYAVELANRVSKYDLEGEFLDWQIRGKDLIALSPLYLADRDQLVFADEGGRIASAQGADRVEIFDQRVEGRPRGWLAADAEGIYLVTDRNLFYHLDRETGEILWKSYLPAAPDGGPLVGEQYIYQAISPSGVVKIDKGRRHIGWQIDRARRFLAEWLRHTVLLSKDYQLLLVDPPSGRVERVTDLGQACDGISNLVNDAVFLTTRGGEILCLRPAGARPLTVADFKSQAMALMQQAEPISDEASEANATEEEP